MRKKIMMVLMGLDIGGAETHVLELSLELNKQGYDVVLVSAGGSYENELSESGIRCFYAPLNKRSIVPMAKSYRILKRLILSEKPDIVHAHARIPGFICGLLQKKYHFRFVSTAHWVFKVNPVLKRLTNWGDRTIAVSDDIREYLKENYNVADDKITNTINGIDTEKFSSVADGSKVLGECDFTGQHPVIVHVSRLDESRAMVADKLVSIAPRLKEIFPDIGIIIAGGGDFYDTISKKADGLGYVKLLGPRTDINEIVAAGDIFVGVSRAALEAMSEEKPSIIAGNEGYIGVFNEEKLDISFKTNFCARECPVVTEDILFADIKRLLEMSLEEMTSLGAYCRKIILENYSVSRMVSDYISVYKKEYEEHTNILVSGYYGFRNLGDDTILINIRDEVKKSNSSTNICVLSNNPSDTENAIAVRAVYRFNPFAVLREIKRCNLLVSGGGSLLQDNTSTRSLVYYSGLIRLAHHFGKKIIFYANGIGPVNQNKNRELVSHVSEMADAISLRDSDSMDLLRIMHVKNKNIFLASDCVYAMRQGDKELGRQLLAGAGVPEACDIVGISVRSVRGEASDNEQFALFADMISDAGYVPVFIVMQHPEDENTADQVISLMKSRAYKIASTYEPYAMMGAISLMSAIVSTRLHSIIFAAHEGVPVLGIIYDPKVKSCLESLSMPSAGDYSSFNAKEAFEKFKDLERNKLEYIDHIKLHNVQLMELAKINNEMLSSFISL